VTVRKNGFTIRRCGTTLSYNVAMSEQAVKATVLVVDDNEQNRALAEATLEDEGYHVVLADSGEAGLAAFETARPDCVLLDVRMPGMNGLEVCARMRALPEGEDVPILFLTALRDVDTFDSAQAAGGDDFLTKPVRPTELALRVQAALKLRRMSTELRGHYALVRRQRDDLMRLQLQKERLTAFVVHDLKNPVSTMDLHAQLLLREASLSDSARESAAHIRDEARNLMRLITNLLDISKSEEGRLEPNRAAVDLPALADEIVDGLTLAARDSGVRLATAIATPSVEADVDLLRRVLENLMENAIRHAPKESEVALEASAADAWVELRVRDHGKGIPPEMRERIFDRFVQVDGGGAVARTGRGLGLAFCKLAVEAHGGTIAVEDGGSGTVFSIRLPHA
jgi:two-component system, sensor histidine kinase and response regulator